VQQKPARGAYSGGHASTRPTLAARLRGALPARARPPNVNGHNQHPRMTPPHAPAATVCSAPLRVACWHRSSPISAIRSMSGDMPLAFPTPSHGGPLWCVSTLHSAWICMMEYSGGGFHERTSGPARWKWQKWHERGHSVDVHMRKIPQF